MSRKAANWLFYTPFAAAYLFLVHPHFIGNSEFTDELIDLLGAVVLLLGIAVRVISRNWKHSHEKRCLVVSGPYSVVRNPMYIGSYLVGLGMCIIVGDFKFTIAFTVFYFLFHTFIVHFEEKHLGKKWPEAYKAYRASVLMWFPLLTEVIKMLRQGMHLPSSPLKAFVREKNTVFGVLLGAFLLEAHEDYVVEGWSIAKDEIIVVLSFATLLLISWVLTVFRPLRKAG